MRLAAGESQCQQQSNVKSGELKRVGLVDYHGLGEFLNELHWEGLPSYDRLERQDLRRSLEAACRAGFSTDEEWAKVTDDERRRLMDIFDIINESQYWFDTMEPVEEEPAWDEDDPERPEGELHSGSPILVILQKSDWELIDRLPLSTAQYWEHQLGEKLPCAPTGYQGWEVDAGKTCEEQV